jgi:stage II sporulation protein D
MGIEDRFWVRVLLFSNKAECTIEIPSAFRIVSTESRGDTSAGGTTREPLPSPTRISLTAGRLLLDTELLAGKEVVFSPETPSIFGLDKEQFRGRLKLIVNRDGRSFEAINLVPLEPYLAGVVGREMSDDWQPQALEAQTIAARTYCLFIKNRFGANRNYDVRRTQASQVYGGIGAESPRVWEAVDRTCGQVLIEPELVAEDTRAADLTRGSNPLSEISHPQSCRLFPAYYSSTCGGHTTRSDQVFGDSYRPLQGVPCPYCRDAAPLWTLYWPMVTFDRETITKQLVRKYPKLVELGEITELAVIEEDCYESFSRLTRIRLTGATGKTDTLRAEDLRLSLDPSGLKLKSAACRIIPWGDGWAFVSGRGWGHGVGMCQYGAKGMAERGSDAWTILRYYYPGAEIVNVY